MKNFVILVVVLVLLAIVATQVPVRDGKTLIESAPAQKLLGKSRQLAEPAARLLDEKMNPPAPVYRWQDSDGTWHLGHNPPPGVAAEQVEMPEVNTMPAEQVINRGI